MSTNGARPSADSDKLILVNYKRLTYEQKQALLARLSNDQRNELQRQLRNEYDGENREAQHHYEKYTPPKKPEF
ncbi:MAG: hypothetical protein AB7V32_02175 [Candidatus Berkiella sp.]